MRNHHLALLDALDRTLAAAPRHSALLVLSTSAVPRVDSQRGMRAGDALAQSIESRIAGFLAGAAPDHAGGVYRIDRGRFACLLPALAHPGQAWAAAVRLREHVGAWLSLGPERMPSDTALGIAIFPLHARDSDRLLACALAAVETALASRDRIAAFDAASLAVREEETRLRARLAQALEAQSFDLVFQPKLELATRRAASCEVLLRWHEDRPGPSRFVPILEDDGLLPRLTPWLLNAALRQRAAAGGHWSVAVNLSALELAEPDLPALVAQALATWDTPADALTLEITETTMCKVDAACLARLEDLRRLGVKLALDDFGTGHASLARLAHLPLDELKIDIAFVRALSADARARRVLQSLVELAHALELAVTAEGVEDATTLDIVRELGCDAAQGFYISPPLPAAELSRLRQA